MLIPIETADDRSSFLSQCTDVDSISSYLSDIGKELSQLELSDEEKGKIVAAFQSTLSSDQGLKPAAEDDVYQDEFEDGEFEKGYEEKLWRRWKGSKSAEDRKEIALEEYRTLIGLKPGTEVRDEVVVEDLSSSAKDGGEAGWSDYLQKLANQKLQAILWRR